MVFVGEKKVAEVTIRVIDYDQKQLSEQELRDIKDGLTYKNTATVTWININGLHDTELIRPVREFILQLSRLNSEIIQEVTQPFVKDLLDLSNQAVDAIDTYRDMLNDHLDIYDSRVSNRLNEIMKVLTIFSAIFFPLTFIAGVYGTNFEYVPELKFHYSYFLMWGVMIVVAGLMLRFFRRKGWL